MSPTHMPAGGGGLNVIALVSGGKDSFFSALHCLENGHRLVALANLHPPTAATDDGDNKNRDSLAAVVGPETGRDGVVVAAAAAAVEKGEVEEEMDLNSFMYQTVGHQVIPLYAEATNIPLYRHPILGGAVQSGRDYSSSSSPQLTGGEQDETESMIPLLQSVLGAHPEANALSAGAILSTYQRTRVESVALRLGLTPLAYLWKFPILPPPTISAAAQDEAQLLFDMAAAGLEARVIKVASGGLDESFLWENVASARGVMRLKKAMGRFGSAGMDTGAVIGEGGEFETLVVDGPRRLFKKRVVVREEDRITVREGGGTAWIKVRHATVEDKEQEEGGEGEEEDMHIRRPELLDPKFVTILDALRSSSEDVGGKDTEDLGDSPVGRRELSLTSPHPSPKVQTWAFVRPQTSTTSTIQEETTALMSSIHNSLTYHNITPSSILSTIIILRSMADFPAINAVYGSLFKEPNPPSRVTISCGDLLPPDGNIAIYVTVYMDGKTDDRQGLHVQGRSYWAPANIGPYSQAITFPVTTGAVAEKSDDDDEPPATKAKIVHIAGQIPLIPASMQLPEGGQGMIEMQLVLSLQHLWRIGVEMGVQWWTSAAVYFPRCQDSHSAVSSARARSLLAWRAWVGAHRRVAEGDDDENDDNGPDLWDKKFNPQYMTYSSEGDGAGKTPNLPDYSLFEDGEEEEEEEDENKKKKNKVPYFFAAEVDELPRSAEAEWHAHAGLSGVDSSSESIDLYHERSERMMVVDGTYEINHCILTTGNRVCVHSVVAVEDADGDGQHAAGRTTAQKTLVEHVEEASQMYKESLEEKLFKKPLPQDDQEEEEVVVKPYLVYVDTGAFAPDQVVQAIGKHELAVIPCASIWGGARGGVRLRMVVLYRY